MTSPDRLYGRASSYMSSIGCNLLQGRHRRISEQFSALFSRDQSPHGRNHTLDLHAMMCLVPGAVAADLVHSRRRILDARAYNRPFPF